MEKKIVLTGIKPTGMPHLGNFLGAIKPALKLAESFEARYFIADYHSLNTIKDPQMLRDYIYEVAAVWLACGLNPHKVLIYKQSAVPETFELTTLINAFTSKGLMNRAHAYKAQVDVNREKNKPEDHRINMGLFSYPILMAADILLFDAQLIPVGRDQVQHIEMAADIAEAVNRNYRESLLTIPEAYIDESTKVINGLDGRKMSKSYDNTIPLFCSEKKLKKLCNKIVTNSQAVEDIKDPENCNVYTLYKHFAAEEQQQALADKYRAGGMGWGYAKSELYEVLNNYIKPMREKYDALITDKTYIDKVLKEGAEKARILANEKMEKLRHAVGVK